jgi:hypothetical protein
MAYSSVLKESIFQDFYGMNRRSDRLNSNPLFYWDLLNGYIKKDLKKGMGVIVQRDGTSKYNTAQLGSDYGSIKKVRNIYETKWNGGGTDIIIRAGTAWGKFDGVDTFAAFDTGRSDDVVGQCVMFKNELLYVDGGIPRKLTAAYVVSNLSADGNMPQDSTAIWVHRDKVWLNSSANTMTAYFSKTNSANAATSWTGSTDAGTIDLSTVLPTGDTLVGFRTYGSQDSGLIALICSKYTAIYKAGANAYDFTFVQYFPTTCVSINAAEYIGNQIVYPSQNTFTSLQASTASDNLDTGTLSEWIDPLYRDLVSQVTDTEYITGCFDRRLNLYYLNFPITNNFQTLIYSVDVKNFVGRWTFPFETYSFCHRRNGVTLVGGDGYVYTMNTGSNDDGAAIEWKIAFPALYFGNPSRYKAPREFEGLLQNSATMTLYIDYWYGLTSTDADRITEEITLEASASYWDEASWDAAYWDAGGNVLYRTASLLGRGRLMFFEIRHNTLDAKITIPWFIIRYLLEGTN